MKIYGRLQSGKLHGLVIMHGLLSNDPKSSCAVTTFDGVGFVGYFDRGNPTGFGWKGLFGGVKSSAWIHGEVDSTGKFSGANVIKLFHSL